MIFSERWAEIVSHTLKEISPVYIEKWTGFAHPDDLEDHFNGKADYYEAEVRMHHKSGNRIWVLDRGKITSWTEDGKPMFMSGTWLPTMPSPDFQVSTWFKSEVPSVWLGGIRNRQS